MIWRKAATLVAIVCMVSACMARGGAQSRRPLVIASGGPGGAVYPLVLNLQQVYARDFPDLSLQVQAVGSSGSVDALEEGSAQIGFSQADIAYLAYSRGTTAAPRPHTNLRGVAVLWSNVAQIAVPRNSVIHSVSDLRGKRVSVGAPGTSTEMLARIVLQAYGLQYRDIRASFSSFSERAKQLRDGEIDAAFVVTAVPSPVVQDMNANPGVRLLPIDSERISALRGQYPFLRPVVVPAGTYDPQEPAVAAVGIDELLVCRKDLDETLVYRLTKAFFDALPSLAKANAAASTVDLEEAPGTPIPLHPGAARYYREREISR